MQSTAASQYATKCQLLSGCWKLKHGTGNNLHSQAVMQCLVWYICAENRQQHGMLLGRGREGKLLPTTHQWWDGGTLLRWVQTVLWNGNLLVAGVWDPRGPGWLRARCRRGCCMKWALPKPQSLFDDLHLDSEYKLIVMLCCFLTHAK